MTSKSEAEWEAEFIARQTEQVAEKIRQAANAMRRAADEIDRAADKVEVGKATRAVTDAMNTVAWVAPNIHFSAMVERATEVDAWAKKQEA